ncbi:hypothetical protein B5F53_16030 [Blautia sp. An249]|uniref:3'-5' exonuclease n=1 Tax=Blautia sp. An249 TaxID=1965603 RepID=UPI000B3923E1|nr:3'-5' exonuclease [Blautia sp. An249]OUO76757.1 hypothetical protein B5F53_16030 [Blautia sp. An249]
MYAQHIILDFEMNPVAKKYEKARQQLHREIIEIGATKVNSSGEIIDTFSCFVKPEFSSDVARYITKLTGIKTTDVYQAASFAEALQNFSGWIGSEKTRIYSWSNSDRIQLRRECGYKHICYPSNMTRWLDFQVIFPKLMELRNRNRRMSLHEATEWYGVDFNQKGAHRALYDAKITTELVAPVLTGEYIAQRDCLKRTVRGVKDEESTGFGLTELCGNFFSQFISNDNSKPEFAR